MLNNVQDITDFTWVDKTANPVFYQRFLDLGNSLECIRQSKTIILDALHLQAGQRVLDLGCGLGDDVFAIAERIGATGQVVGADISERMIEEAKRRTPAGRSVEFLVSDAHHLPFADNTFDGVRSERLLMHVTDAERVLDEMTRVVRPGGRVAIFDFDWETFMVDSPDRELTRTLLKSFADTLKQGWIGRQLPRMFRERQFSEVQVAPQTIFIDFEFFSLLIGGHLERLKESGRVSAGDLKTWWRGLSKESIAGRFFAGFTALIVSGSKA
jgi:ubiquinone/menaquinone biosynthesis C-methylase UbiE